MLPSLAAHIGLTTVQMGPLLTAKGLGGLAGSFLSPLLPLVGDAAASTASPVFFTPARGRLFPSDATSWHQLPTPPQSLLMPGGLLSIALCFFLIPLTSDLFQLSVVYVFCAGVYQAVSVAAHTLIAQEHGEKAGPHLNGINALFGAGSLLAPMLHASLSPTLQRAGGGPLASYWLIAAFALASAVPFLAGMRLRGGGSAQAASAHGDEQPRAGARSGAAHPPRSLSTDGPLR